MADSLLANRSRREFLARSGCLTLATAFGGAMIQARARAAPAPDTIHVVAIEAMQFGPAVLSITLGDTVQWANRDMFPHTATADDGTFDSQAIASGGAWSFTPQRAGDYSYRCLLHPTMKARLIVRHHPEKARP